MTVHEVEFILGDVLQSVVDDYADTDHPLRRVDRDNSLVYETGASIDMQQPVRERTEKLKHANYVGVATETTDPSPSGSHGRYQVQTAMSIRLEGYSGSYGCIDPTGDSGVVFSELFDDVFGAIQDAMSYPDVGRPGRTYRDLTITNVNDSSSQWAEFHQGEFDVLFNGLTDA